MYTDLEPRTKLTKNFTEGECFAFWEDSFIFDKEGSIPQARVFLNYFQEDDFYPLGFFKGQEKSLLVLEKPLELEGMEFIKLRDYSRRVDAETFKIAGRAFLKSQYFREHKFCGMCGNKMEYQAVYNTYALKCNNCGNIAWNRVSNAIIVAVRKGDKLLMAHNRNYGKNKYSILAGFVEYGESAEEAVRREVFEEVGIKVKNIKYFSSQAWPFPNSYMLGFTAEYESGEITPDGVEIIDASWFTKEEVKDLLNPSISISARLVENFLES